MVTGDQKTQQEGVHDRKRRGYMTETGGAA